MKAGVKALRLAVEALGWAVLLLAARYAVGV